MEDNDDFEFVDNDKSGFDEFVDDAALINDDDMKTMSDINRELKEIQDLKKHLKSQCIESNKLLKRLKDQSTTNSQLQSQLKQELQQVTDLKTNLKSEQQEFAQKKQELNELLLNMSSVPSNISKGQNLIEQLTQFYNETSSIETELNKLKTLRVQQEEMINQCKINIETLRSNQVSTHFYIVLDHIIEFLRFCA